ncbi:MAG TPA: PAS domain-containing protein [Gammaproteobacteria bacterium]|jgi:hypothetical protein|nr:PAS domain-containing protein [Gammaproteobacteria bacterium]
MANQEITNLPDYLEIIIGLMPGHVYWKDTNSVFLGCNDLQAKDAGFTSRYEIIGKTDYEMPWREQADILIKIDREVMETGTPITVEEPSKLADGTDAIFLTKKVPFYHNGKIIGVVGISFDITKQKETEQKLQEIQYKLAGMTTVSAVIAHELRTPLAALDANANSLQKYFPELIKCYQLAREANLPVSLIREDKFKLLSTRIEAMREEIKSAFTFIDMQLINLNYAEIKQGDVEIFSIKECIEEAIIRYPFDASQRDFLQVLDHHDFYVKGNKILLIHLFFNLIKNALYSIAAAGKGNILISLGIRKCNGLKLVYVTTLLLSS